MNKYNETWKKLHIDGYFKNHRLYNSFEPIRPHTMNELDIKDKFVLDLGCGFGRHMHWMCQHAAFVYGIDVDNIILNQTKEYLKLFNNFGLETVETYKNNINIKFDYIFSRYVFQHISKDQTKEYINWIYDNLNIGGTIDLQFRIGDKLGFIDGIEPRTEHSIEEVSTLLSRFKIIYKELKNKDNLYIVGTK